MSTGSAVTRTHIDTTRYWNYVFPATLFVVGGFAFHVIYSMGDMETIKRNAFSRRGMNIPKLNISMRSPGR